MRAGYTLIACITGMLLAAYERQWVVLVPLLLVGAWQAFVMIQHMLSAHAAEEEEEHR